MRLIFRARRDDMAAPVMRAGCGAQLFFHCIEGPTDNRAQPHVPLGHFFFTGNQLALARQAELHTAAIGVASLTILMRSLDDDAARNNAVMKVFQTSDTLADVVFVIARVVDAMEAGLRGYLHA